MRATSIIPAVLLVGCFADPPPSGGSGDGSTGPDATSSSSTDVQESSTTSREEEGTTGGGSTTGSAGSSTSFEASSSETTEGETEASYCMRPENADALLCTDFDADSPGPDAWALGNAFGFIRTVETAPAPFSAPQFMRISRNREVANDDPVQALLEGDAIDVGQSGGVELDLVFRLPPDVADVCGNRALRLFSFEYVSPVAGMPIVRIVGAVSESQILITSTDEGGETTVLENSDGVHTPLVSGWRTLRVRLATARAVGGAAVEVLGSSGLVEVTVSGFEPVDDGVDVTVGPSFEPGFEPPSGCSYDVDNIVLRAIPLE